MLLALWFMFSQWCNYEVYRHMYTFALICKTLYVYVDKITHTHTYIT